MHGFKPNKLHFVVHGNLFEFEDEFTKKNIVNFATHTLLKEKSYVLKNMEEYNNFIDMKHLTRVLVYYDKD